MTKQEQIEELQKILPNIEVVKAMYGDVDFAEFLYDRGCRKLSKNIESIWNKYDIKIDMLEKINANLQELNENYYNEAKDLRREVNRLKAHAMINDEHLHVRIKEQARKETAKEIITEVQNEIFKYLGVKSIKEADKLSLLGSLITYDLITDKLHELAHQYGVKIGE